MTRFPRRRVLSALALAAVLGLAAGASAATFSVNSPADGVDTHPGDGTCSTGGVVATGGTPIFALECTLRAALHEANALPGGDVIRFASYIATDGGGFVRITPTPALPAITDTVLLDGYSAPGYDTNDPEQHPIVQIDGGSAGVLTSGLVVSGGTQSTIRGVAVYGFSGNGITLLTDSNRIQGSWVGLFNWGFVDGNSGDGIHVGANARANVIGAVCGDEPMGCSGRGNVLSGNGGHGVEVLGNLAVIAGNRIGTRVDGNGTTVFQTSTGNGGFGIRLFWAPGPDPYQQTRIGNVGYARGGLPVPAGNLVSGNALGGIRIESGGNHVRANLVGTRADGAGNAGNGGHGIEIWAGRSNLVGDVEDGTRNVIAWNEGTGVVIGRYGVNGTDDNVVFGNSIGTDASASLPLPNDADGVEVRDGSSNTIAHNTIAGNLGNGLWDLGSLTNVVGNHIGASAAGLCLGNGASGVVAEGVSAQIGSETSGGQGNVIGCNGGRGVLIGGPAQGTSVQANHVGTDAEGRDLGNALAGIRVGGTGSFVGGSMNNDEGNVVGFNRQGIVTASGAGPSVIRGNFVGTNAAGDDLGNDMDGVFVDGSVDQQVGDPAVPGGHNAIAWNGGAGVLVEGAGAMDNPVRRNAFHHNAGLGIDLAPAGITANDPGDADTGPNELQNHPVLDPAGTGYDPGAGLVSVRYHVDADAAHASYPLTVDFYASDPDRRELTWIGETVYSTPGEDHDVAFAPDPAVSPESLVGARLVATATDQGPGDRGNTSELGAPVPLPEPGTATALAAGALLLHGLGARRRR